MDLPNLLRVVLLGKTGSGKSSLANTILGTQDFKVKHFTNADAAPCQAETGSVIGRNLTLVDTPGYFHPAWSEQQLKEEIVRCVSGSAPGPHAFLIVLKVEKFTEQESQVIREIQESFSAEVFKYSVVIFTHGDQLSEGMKIEEFIEKNRYLKDLVEKCGRRCHVVDNKYWKNIQQDDYRNNKVRVAQLLSTIQTMVSKNRGGCYSTTMLKNWQKQKQPSVFRIFDCFKKMSTKTCLRVFVGVTLLAGMIFMWRKAKEQITATI